MLVVKEDKEPAQFYAHFLAWDVNAPHTMQARPNVEEEQSPPDAASLLAEYSRKYAVLLCVFHSLDDNRYTYEELVAGKYPKGIDVGRLEV